MDSGIRKILFAKFLVEYVGDYDYVHLDDKTRTKLLNQDVILLASSSPSDSEFLIASQRMSFSCKDGNFQDLYPYYELLCMYSELGFWKKFCSTLLFLDVEISSLTEAIESNDAYFDPLYMYYVPFDQGFKVFDVDDDSYIGHCQYLGGPIDYRSVQPTPKCEVLTITDPFCSVLDRYLDVHAERYFPERFQTDQLQDNSDEDSITEEDVLSTDSIDNIIHEKVYHHEQLEDACELVESVSVTPNVESTVLSSISNSIYDVERDVVGVSSTPLLSGIITTISQKISELLSPMKIFCSEKGCLVRQCYYDNSRLIKTSLSLRGLEVSLIRKYYIN